MWLLFCAMSSDFFWLDTFSCGHEQITELVVDVDRNLSWDDDTPWGRIGSPTVCRSCDPPDYDVIITATRRISAVPRR